MLTLRQAQGDKSDMVSARALLHPTNTVARTVIAAIDKQPEGVEFISLPFSRYPVRSIYPEVLKTSGLRSTRHNSRN